MNIEQVSGQEIGEFVNGVLGDLASEPFKPVAYFDTALDCVRVIVRDCSVTEVRINEVLTILEANYPLAGQPYVGFNLKGIRYICNQHGLGSDGPVKVTEVLSKLLEDSSDRLVRFAVAIAFALAKETKADELPLAA